MTLNEEVMRKDVAFYRELGFEIDQLCVLSGEDYYALYGEPPVQRYGEILCGM